MVIRAAVGSTKGTSGSITAGSSTQSSPIRIQTSAPDTIIRHNISDEELGMLGGSKRDGLGEFTWAMVALATGAAPAAVDAFAKSYLSNKPSPLGALSLVQILMVVAGVVAAVLAFTLIVSRGKTAGNLVAQIRKRPPS
jgi:hypothetical protein